MSPRIKRTHIGLLFSGCLLVGCQDHTVQSTAPPATRATMQGEEHMAFVPLLKGEHPNDVIDSVYGLTRMHVAARDGNVAYLTYLLENGGDVNVKSSGGRGLSGETPMHWAKTSETVAVLLEHGADRDAPAAIGQHALHSLASRNRQDAVTALIRAGADVNSTDSYLGWNAVGWACCGLATDRAHDDVEVRLRERQSLIRYTRATR